MALFDEISTFLGYPRRGARSDDAAQGDWIRAIRRRNGRERPEGIWHLHDGSHERTLIGVELGTVCGRRFAVVSWSAGDHRRVERHPGRPERKCDECAARATWRPG